MQQRIHFLDLGVGDASNKRVVIEDRLWFTNDIECACKLPGYDGYYDVPAGVRPYGRIQTSGTLDSNYSMCAYALGGDGG